MPTNPPREPAPDPATTGAERAFAAHPHRSFLGLALPVLVSLIAEPLTGLVDTLLVGRLGSGSLAGLGVATTLISSVLWIFNFLGIGTQTEVARAHGARDLSRARGSVALAMWLGALTGLVLLALGMLFAEPATRFMGTDDLTTPGAVTYLRIRLLSAPAVLITMAAFGAMRGLHDMRRPLWIALVTNALNLGLDLVLIFGVGPFPRLELAGAAWAAVAAQWIGAGLALRAVGGALGWPDRIPWNRTRALLAVGRDLFVRTGLLLLFMTLAVRTATRIGTDAGAAHALIRSLWTFAAFLLDAYAVAAQSLVGSFLASGRVAVARSAARLCLGWSLATSALLGGAMLAAAPWVLAALPVPARAAAAGAWTIAALSQPLSGVAFATDGIHWGTGDYRFLRNAMAASTAAGAAGLFALEGSRSATLDGVWIVTALWLFARGLLGWLRVWPGIGEAPLGRRALHAFSSPPAE